MSLDELGIGDRDEHADTEHTGENNNWESFHVRCFLVYVTVSLTHLSVSAT
jgi:hypothetical protein